MSRLTDVNLPVLVKLGSIMVHAEEVLGYAKDVHPADRAAIETLLTDPDVTAWRAQMDAASFLPKKR